MVLLETITFVLGIIYGYMSLGRENRSALLRKGLIIGIVLAIILVGVGLLMGGTILLLSGVAVFIEVVILTVLFIIGTWIGDWIEGRSRSRVVKVSP